MGESPDTRVNNALMSKKNSAKGRQMSSCIEVSNGNNNLLKELRANLSSEKV